MLEVEIKLAIGAAESEIRRLETLGARLAQPRGLEENVLLDLPGQPMRARAAMLRVRQYGGRSFLTYKEPATGPEGYKVRREIEVAVPDFEAMIRIFQAAGLTRVWRYMKYRTVYEMDGLHLLLDETPIGNYLELEGARASIDSVAAGLGRSPGEYITLSYRGLFELDCARRGVVPGDMIFEAAAPAGQGPSGTVAP
jgi:adenylate cyclase class 2